MSDLLTARRTYLSAGRWISRWAEERGEDGQLAAMQVEILRVEGMRRTKNKKLVAGSPGYAILGVSNGKVNSMPISSVTSRSQRPEGTENQPSKPGRLTKEMRDSFYYAGFRDPTSPAEALAGETLNFEFWYWAPTPNQIKHIMYEVRRGIRDQKA